MNNDLKNFLEGEKIKEYQAMDSFLTEYDTPQGKLFKRSLENLNKDRHLFIEQMQLHDTRLINFVLELVEKEAVEYKKRIGMPSGFGENAVRADASRDTLDYISTIINNLRV